MMNIDLHPDIELKDALSNRIVIDDKAILVFADNARPDNFHDDDFLDISYNGQNVPITTDLTIVGGQMTIDIVCKLKSDGSVKDKRIGVIMAQLSSAVDRLKTPSFFFKVDRNTPTTPTYPDKASGYSISPLNIQWRTSH